MRVMAETPPELRPAVETYVHPETSTTLATDVERSDRVGGPMGIAQRLQDPEVFARVERWLEGSLGGDLRPGISTFAHAREGAWIGRDISRTRRSSAWRRRGSWRRCCATTPARCWCFRRPETDAWVENTKATIANEATIVASDGIYRPGLMHPRGYGTFPRFLRLATREWATLELPAAVHKVTGRTAGRYGLGDRGVLRVGAAADVVVFDPATVAEGSTFANLRRVPVGIRRVFVRGVRVAGCPGGTANPARQ
jgi:N-acyl-D-amino-acid deacylase